MTKKEIAEIIKSKAAEKIAKGGALVNPHREDHLHSQPRNIRGKA